MVIRYMQSVFFFFFKQKTAYEMRISDWSSDVCSSDLVDVAPRHTFEAHAGNDAGNTGRTRATPAGRPHALQLLQCFEVVIELLFGAFFADGEMAAGGAMREECRPVLGHRYEPIFLRGPMRSEEHTSELKSLMRITS